jgi:hypothetical protein
MTLWNRTYHLLITFWHIVSIVEGEEQNGPDRKDLSMTIPNMLKRSLLRISTFQKNIICVAVASSRQLTRRKLSSCSPSTPLLWAPWPWPSP